MSTDQTSKFKSSQPSSMWQLENSNSFTTGDIDGDGRTEIIVVSADSNMLSLGVLSYFEYGDLSDNWNSDSQYKLLTTWMTGTQMPGGGWEFSPDDQFSCADLDNDGRDEIVALKLENPSDLTYPCYLGVFKWQIDPDSGYYTIAVQNVITCTVSFADFTNAQLYISNIYIGDIDGDGADEIIAYGTAEMDTRSTIVVAIYKWENNSLTPVWVGDNLPGAGWAIGPDDRFYIADLDGDGQMELLAFKPGSDTDPQQYPCYLGVLKWNSSNKDLEAIWVTDSYISGSATWNFSTIDQFYCADLNADGAAEILCFKPQSDTEQYPCYLGVFKWSVTSNEVQVIWVTSSGISGSATWNFSTIDQFYCADLNADGAAEILCFKPQSDTEQYPCYLGVFGWNSAANQVQVLWIVSSTISGNDSWNFNITDQFFCADINGTKKAQILAFKQGDPCNNYQNYPCYLGVFGWSGAAVEVLWEVYYAIPSWSMDVFTGIASQGLTAFTTDGQQWAYGYISNYFDDDSGCDIRSQYAISSSTDMESLKNWAVDLRGGVPPKPDDAPEYVSSDDWNTVQQVLAPEFDGVGSTVELILNMLNYAGNLYKNERTIDLPHCKDFIAIPETVSSSLPYWPGQFAVMVLWGLAAAEPELGALWAVPLAMTASVAGSMLAAPSDPASFDIAGLEEAADKLGNTLETTYGQSVQQYQQELEDYLNDETKIQVIGELAENAWKWQDIQSDIFPQSTTNSCRVSFYQQLIQVVFNILVWENCRLDSPCYLAEAPGLPSKWTPIENVPQYAYWTQQVDTQLWNIYLLCQGDAKSICKTPNFIYPSQELMDDLFSTLGVDQEEFFTSQKGWCNIKQITTPYPNCK